MRGTAVISGLIAAIEAITPDDTASVSDTFKHMKGPDVDHLTARDRTFVLLPAGGPVRDQEVIQSTYPSSVELSLELAVGYTVTKRTMARIIQDAEQILDTVEAWQSTSGVYLSQLTDSIIVPDETGLVVESRLRVIYQLDDLSP